jgi:hypothetical protein
MSNHNELLAAEKDFDFQLSFERAFAQLEGDNSNASLLDCLKALTSIAQNKRTDEIDDCKQRLMQYPPIRQCWEEMSVPSSMSNKDWINLLAGRFVRNADPETVRKTQIFRSALLSHSEKPKNPSDIPYPDILKNVLAGLETEESLPQKKSWLEKWRLFKPRDKFKTQKRTIFQTLKEAFFGPPMVWGFAFATVFVFAVSVTVLCPVFCPLSPKSPIDISYDGVAQTIHANNTSEMTQELRDFQFTWETTEQTSNLAFSPTQKQPTLATKAFGAGLLTGRETLLGKRDVVLPSPLLPPVSVDNWSNTEWKIYFDFGRWTFLLWTASQFQPPEPQIFWDEQRQIFAHFKTAFVERAEAKKDGEARDLLDTQLKKRVQPFLDKLPDSSISDEFGFKLENMMDFLAADL